MSYCRTCLTLLGDKGMDASQLPKDLEELKSYSEIIAFCLNIQIVPEPDLNVTLCEACYYKIIDYYEFKVEALKNDAYWKSIQNNKNTLIKCNNSSDNVNNYGSQNLFEVKNEIKGNTETPEDMQSDDQLLSVRKEIKYYDEFIEDVNKNEPVVYDRGRGGLHLSEPQKKRFKKQFDINKEIALAATSKSLLQTNSSIQTDDSVETNVNSAQNSPNKLLIDTMKTMYYLYFPSFY